MNPLETVEIARRQMSLFFIVDTSGSMDGEKIAAVNTAIREVLRKLRISHLRMPMRKSKWLVCNLTIPLNGYSNRRMWKDLRGQTSLLTE